MLTRQPEPGDDPMSKMMAHGVGRALGQIVHRELGIGSDCELFAR